MKKFSFFVVFAILQFLQNIFAQTISPPVAKKVTKVFTEHGHERVDDYYWMNNRSDTIVINHLKEEKAYTEEYMKRTEALQKKIYNELIARIPGKDESLSTKRNGYWYYTRFEEGKQYPYYLRRKGTMTAAEEIFINVPELAKSYKIYYLHGRTVSKDNRILAYGTDTAGNRHHTLFFKNLSTGKLYPETISNTFPNYEFANDNKTLYYILNDYTMRGYKIMRHTLGTDQTIDKEIYTEKDSTFRIFLRRSKNNKYIFIYSVGGNNTTESYYIDADNSNAAPVIIQPRKNGIKYYVDYFEGNVFHIWTNKDAKNYKLVKVSISNPAMYNWKDVIPYNEKAYLQGWEVLKDYYVLQTTEKGLSQIKILDRKKNKWHNVNFGQEDYVAYMSMATDEYESDSIRYDFTSLTTPETTYLYNLKTGKKKVLKQQKVGGNYNADLYKTKRLWATATDGTKIPVSLVYRKDKFKKDGSNSLLLYGYGAYGVNTDPYFDASIISLLDRGISYAIAHIRGGGEMGTNWFEQGNLLHKKNSFTDFIDVAQFLVNKKYTSKEKLFANGASMGGTLMGAITNLRPDLFKGVIAEVPKMDIITEMFNPDLPLTTNEYNLLGDPNKKEHYEYMLSWSPFDNVRKAKYPAILATGGLNDTQVPYFSPAKWVAKVRENNLGTNPVLFKVEMGAGHGGESGRFERQKLTALKYAFILDQLGWKE